MPILSKTWLLLALPSLLLGTDTEASHLLDLNANPRGFQIVYLDLTDNFIPEEAFLYLIPLQQSHQSKVYLTIPGSD